MEDIKLNNENLNTNSSSNDTTIVNKPKKQFSRRKLIGILCGSLGAAALVGGITPLAIYVKNKNKVVTHDVVIQDGSTKGVKILAKDIQLNKESTITIQLPEGDYLDLDNNPNVNVSVGGKKLVKNTDFTIEAIDNYGSIVRLSSEEETKAHSLYRIYITPEASTSLDVSIKVISETIDFDIYDDELSKEGFVNTPKWTPSRPKYHKPLKFDCSGCLFDGDEYWYGYEGIKYLFDETLLGTNPENSIVITVGEGENARVITKDDCIIDKDAQTCTIKEGIIDGPVTVQGRLNKYSTKFNAGQYVVEDSLPQGVGCTYGYTDDYIEAFKLESSHKDKWGNWTAGGIDPQVEIKSLVFGGKGWPSEISFVQGTEQDPEDFYLTKSYSTTDRRYHYDIIFTKEGREKVQGPLSINCSATTKDNIIIQSGEGGNSVILGLPSSSTYYVWYNPGTGQPLNGKVTMVDDGGTGYIYNEDTQLLEVPDGVQPKAGKITLGGTLDSAYTERTIEVKEATFSNTFKEIDNGTEKDPDFSDGVVIGHTYKITTSIDPSIDVKWTFGYDKEAFPEGVIKFGSDSEKGEVNLQLLQVPELGKNNVLDITVNATLGDSGPKVFQEDKHIKLNLVNEIFARTSWDDISTIAKTYEQSGRGEDAQKALCWKFGDIKYIEEGTTAQEHLANFIGKEHKLNIKDTDTDTENATDYAVEHTMRIVDIEHDDIVNGGGKALFTFDSKEVVTDYKYAAIKSIFSNTSKNYDFSTSVLYKNLNSTTTVSDTGGWKDNTLINRIENANTVSGAKAAYNLKTSNVKQVIKQAGKYDSNRPAFDKYVATGYNAYFFPLTMTEMSMSPEGEHPGYLTEGSPYAYYVGKTAEDKKKAPAVPYDKSNAIEADKQYWLTSPSFEYNASGELIWDYCSWLVDENGNPNGDYEVWHCGNEGIGVSFAFCI